MSAKQAFIRTFVFLLIVLLDFGLAQEYNWSANLRFRARTDKSSDVDWQRRLQQSQKQGLVSVWTL